jgi:hypothetical protein
MDIFCESVRSRWKSQQLNPDGNGICESPDPKDFVMAQIESRNTVALVPATDEALHRLSIAAEAGSSERDACAGQGVSKMEELYG